ncbi:MAG: oligosaccharide flippase family protein [Erysipelotrichaceae bacterium]|uniref:lipopolysaccharide biosynthesis protein n=1 Tax=Floccifex sp. TaxID=2815810 RepID=UPI002A74DC57|nr:oligosaccharide flippase family protein [Floccifex sp.]MDD7281494.1 oligosaccharide flippase family protein [Erysipelotrichaceae bacterium]MDY2957686.1 oligosaccharide flippase family protein [Floccifex sp.]
MNNKNVGMILSYVSTFLNMIIGLFLSSFLLRKLGDTEYGIYQTIASFANYLILFEFGTGTVMTRNISMCRGKNDNEETVNKNVATIWKLTNILVLVICLVSVVFYCSIDILYSNSMSYKQILYGKKIFIFTTIYLIFSFYGQTCNGIILAFEKYSFASIQNIIRMLLRTICLVTVLSFYEFSIMIAIVDSILGIIFSGYSFYYCKRVLKLKFSKRYFDKTILKSSIPLCIAIFLQTIVNQANNNVDKFLIGIYLSPESVTMYSISLYIFSVFSSLTTIPISINAPQINKQLASGIKKENLIESLIKSCRLIALIGGLVIFGFISVGKQFICIIYGSQYLDAWFIALILMIPMYINMTNGILINLLDFYNKRMSRSIILFSTTILNIVLTLYGINKWGVIGAAIATAISTIIGQVIIMNIYYYKVLNIPVLYMFKKSYKGILPTLIIATIISFLLGKNISNAIFSFLICGISFVILAILGLLLFGLNEQEKSTLICKLNKGGHR